MRAITVEEMQKLEAYAIKQLEIPSLILMETAALRSLEVMDLDFRHSFAVICGVGNNGGDGLAIARGLIALDKKVYVFILGDLEKASHDFLTNYKILRHITDDVFFVETLGDLDHMVEKFQEVNTLIDAIFGTGLSREIRGIQAVVIEQINEARIYTISVDLPSGIHGTNGKILGSFVEADEIITFEFLKQGLVKNPYIAGEIKVVSIGIPSICKKKVLGDLE